MTLLEASDYRAEAAQIVGDVFAMMLGYAAEPSGRDESTLSGSRVVASVSFNGAWQGAAMLECDEATCKRLCARLMKIPEPAAMDEDALDTIGELINMVGGNLKSILPGGVVLSPPTILFGTDLAIKISGQQQQKTVFGYACEAGPFWLTLVQLPCLRA